MAMSDRPPQRESSPSARSSVLHVGEDRPGGSGVAGPRRHFAAVWSMVVGTLAVLGLLLASALCAVITAGAIQWLPLPDWVQSSLSLCVLVLGLVLAGRVGVDVAARLGGWCTVAAAGMVGLAGGLVARVTETHGDGVEGWQVAAAVACVLVTTGGSALVVQHRRESRAVSSSATGRLRALVAGQACTGDRLERRRG